MVVRSGMTAVDVMVDVTVCLKVDARAAVTVVSLAAATDGLTVDKRVAVTAAASDGLTVDVRAAATAVLWVDATDGLTAVMAAL